MGDDSRHIPHQDAVHSEGPAPGVDETLPLGSVRPARSSGCRTRAGAAERFFEDTVGLLRLVTAMEHDRSTRRR